MLEALAQLDDWESHLVLSASGALTAMHELDMGKARIEALADVVHSVKNIGASIASGSFLCEGMVIAPCSMRTLADRVKAFRARVEIPKDKLRPVMEAAIRACRERSAKYISMPANESFVLEFVQNQPWSGYNWYKGDAHSLIQINTEFPIYIERAVDLGCHEGYPGHHVYNALLEQTLVKGKNWQEFSVYPLYSPMSLVAEGSANYGILMAFTPEERLAFERDVLYPLAGLDPALAEKYAALTQLFGKLAYADNDAARAYLDGKATREQTVEWLVNVLLYPPEKAEQRIRFYDANRGYVINYTVGADLVGDYVKRHATSADPETARAQRWTAFRQLLSSPRLAGSLR
eukprot:gene34389-42414_t